MEGQSFVPVKQGRASQKTSHLGLSWGREVALVVAAKLCFAFHDFPDQNFAVAPGGILSCSAKPRGGRGEGGLQLLP